jgi:fido (protein-threonine AMPylation protein)
MTNSKAASKRGKPTHDAVFQRFAATVGLLESYGGLPKPNETRGIWDKLWHYEVHNSTAIEGNTLVLKEVEILLNEGKAVGSKDIKDYLEVLGYADAATWIYDRALGDDEWQQTELLTLTEVRHVHVLAMGKVWDVAPHRQAYDSEAPGNFRQHDIMSFQGGMKPPSHPHAPAEVKTWLDIVNEFGKQVRAGDCPVEKAPEQLAYIHKEFERVHPFIDGNGRTGRLLLNFILLRLDWPPVIIQKNQRKRYLLDLDKADKGDLSSLAELLSRAIIDSAYMLIPNIAGPAKWVPLETLADESFSLPALRQAVSRGRLEAIKGVDGRYLSSKAAIERYRNSKYGHH